MNKILLSACIVVVISLNGCRSEQPEYDSSLPKVPASSTVSEDTSKPLLTAPANPAITTTIQQPLTSKSTAALNPKHGEPGHRCDIAVGAPLNSPARAVQPVAPNKTLPAQPVALPNSGGTVRINPAHGQPGHDCTVPVGQPLKG